MRNYQCPLSWTTCPPALPHLHGLSFDDTKFLDPATQSRRNHCFRFGNCNHGPCKIQQRFTATLVEPGLGDELRLGVVGFRPFPSPADTAVPSRKDQHRNQDARCRAESLDSVIACRKFMIEIHSSRAVKLIFDLSTLQRGCLPHLKRDELQSVANVDGSCS